MNPLTFVFMLVITFIVGYNEGQYNERKRK